MKLTNTQKAIIQGIIDASGDSSDVKELITNVQDLEGNSFRVHYAGFDWRVIDEQDIDEIMQDELSDDEYILGCFNAWFLADVLDIDQDVIEAMQAAEAFEAIGKLVLSMGKLEELQKEYASADGYGHHFSSYDGNGHETATVDGTFYHIFNEG